MIPEGGSGIIGLYIVNTELGLSFRRHQILGRNNSGFRVCRYCWVDHELLQSCGLPSGRGNLSNVTIGFKYEDTWDWSLLRVVVGLYILVGRLTKTNSCVRPVGVGVLD